MDRETSKHEKKKDNEETCAETFAETALKATTRSPNITVLLNLDANLQEQAFTSIAASMSHTYIELIRIGFFGKV